MPKGIFKYRITELLGFWLRWVRTSGDPADCKSREGGDVVRDSAVEHCCVDEILAENQELKARIERLHASISGSSSVTDCSPMVDPLKVIINEQQAKLRLASKKLKDLLAYHNLYRALKAERDLLVTKLEHQSKLLHSMVNENPNLKVSIAKIEGIIEENQRLKTELGKSSNLLDQLRNYLPADYQQKIEELVKKNLLLIGDLDEKGVQLEAALAGSDGNLMDYFDRLGEENAHLKKIKESRQFIDEYIASHAENRNPEEVIEILDVENQRMELTLGAREEQIGYLSGGGALNPGLLDAYTKLRKDCRYLFLENQHKEQLSCHHEEEKQRLYAQARGKTALIKENHRLEMELKSCNETWSNNVKEAQTRIESLEITSSAIQSKYEFATAENINLRNELSILKNEYEMLMKQLGTAFGDLES